MQNDLEIIGEAADGYEAINKCREIEPDVILMDIAMPNMDGLEATRQIKKTKKVIKILILTQQGNKENILAAARVEANGIIPKEALGSELVSAIHAVFEGGFYLHPLVAAPLIDDYRNGSQDNPFDRLTAREREVLKLIADGHGRREISKMLLIGTKEVTEYRPNILKKLDIHNQTELLKYAVLKGLTSVDQ